MFRAVDELDDIIDLAAGFRIEKREFGGRFELARQLGEQVGKCVPKLLLFLELVRVGPGPAGILDFLMSGRDLAKRARDRARALHVDLERKGVLAVGSRTHCSGVLETRPPSQCSPSIDRGKPGRRSARHDMFGSNDVRVVVEIDEVAGGNVDRADAKTHFSGIDAVEVGQPLQRRLQHRRIVEAGRVLCSIRLQERVTHSGENIPGAPNTAAAVADQRLAQISREIPCAVHWRWPAAERIDGDFFPEIPQLLHPVSGRLPAINAALIAPMEMPATQSG